MASTFAIFTYSGITTISLAPMFLCPTYIFSQVLSGHGGIGLENLRASVECQVAHRNALVAACQQNEVIVKKTVSLSKNAW